MTVTTATWIPAWYELDQDITLDEVNQFLLVKTNNTLRFATGLDSDSGFQVTARILHILNSQIGEVTRIDAKGLSYKFYKKSGEFTQIEAEESPGKIEYPEDIGGYLVDKCFIIQLEILK